MLELRFAGTGTAAPRSFMRPSCIYFRCDWGLSGLLDIGAGAIHTLAGLDIDPMMIENIFLSHFHSDHVGDLIMMLHSNNATPGKTREKALNVHGPAGLRYLSDTIQALFPETVPESYALNIRELAPNTWDLPLAQGGTLSCCPTGHTRNSTAYRFSHEGYSFVYTGDSAFSADLVKFCSGANVLITECSYPDEMRTEDHLCVRETAALAAGAGVKHLVIVHRYPQNADRNILPEIREGFDGFVSIPKDGDRLCLF